jgi:arylsulfatase A-like enzyme
MYALLIIDPARSSRAGRVDHTLGSLTDLPATVLDLCGLGGTFASFGRSLLDTSRINERCALIAYQNVPALRTRDLYFVNTVPPTLLENKGGIDGT